MKLFILIINIIFITGIWVVQPADAQLDNNKQPFIYDHKGRRDPLWPLINTGGGIINYGSDYVLADLSVEGIMMGEQGKSLAIINGKIVKENDKIGQYTVKKINPETVILLKAEQEYMLKLKKEE